MGKHSCFARLTIPLSASQFHFSRPWMALWSTVFLAPAFALATVAPEPPPFIWRKSSIGVSATSEYFTTNANYDDARGSFKRIPGGNTLSAFETRSRLRYSFGPRFSTFAGLGFAQIRTLDSQNEKTNSGLTEGFLGANFLLSKKWIRIVPEIEASFPVTATATNQTTPLTSDGVAFGRAGFFFKKPFKHLELNGYAGVHVPAQGLAKRFMYDLSLDIPLFDAMMLGAGFAGYETIVSDELLYSDRTKTTTNANVGSHRYWAYNPHVMEVRGWIGFRADRNFEIKAGYAKTIDGVRAAEGQSILISLAFLSAGQRSIETVRERAKRQREEQLRTFDEQEVETGDRLEFEAEDGDPSKLKGVKPNSSGDELDNTEQILENRQ